MTEKLEYFEFENLEEKGIKININKEIWAKENYNKLIKKGENKFEENRSFKIVELAENLYRENLKSYADIYLNFLMSDDYFHCDGAPITEKDRALDIYYFLFDSNVTFDFENGIETNDEYFEMIEDVIEDCNEIQNQKEEEYIEELLWGLHLIDLQEKFLSKYEDILK